MSQTILSALLYSVIAGVMNGSFALPTKNIKTWGFEHIWLNYAFWAFLVLPWLTIFVFDPHIGHVYRMMNQQTWLILLIGGFLFGIGQICFAITLQAIGFGLSFVINIGLGTALGVLFPLVILHPDQIFSPAGVTTIIGIGCIIFGLLLSYYAGRQRDRASYQHTLISDMKLTSRTVNKSSYGLAILLVVVAGIFSAGQNYIFALTSDVQPLALASGAGPIAASIVIWPVFLTCGFIPYALYMLYRHDKNNSFGIYRQSYLLQNSIFGIVMGGLWFIPLVMYSFAAALIGDLGPVVAWPLFMALQILTSNFWGWRYKEWENCQPGVKGKMLSSVGALVVAVFVLAYGANLSH